MADDETILGLQPGDRLNGRYELVRILGAGGMGQVWLATDANLDQEVALKVLPQALARDARAIGRLKEEAKANQRLSHENIVRLHNFEIDESRGGTAYLVMEYVDGETGDQLLVDHPKGLPVDVVVAMIRQVARAVDYAHGRQMLHRDIKPQNIMRCRRDRKMMLLDFGIANEARESLTRVTGQAVGDGSGTLVYMSPQQLLGRDGKGNDIYSLAATAYELLGGRPPFGGGGDVSLQIREVAPRLLEHVPASVNAALMAGLAKRTKDRPATAGAFAKLLEKSVSVEEDPGKDAVRRVDPPRRVEGASTPPVPPPVGNGSDSEEMPEKATAGAIFRAFMRYVGMFVGVTLGILVLVPNLWSDDWMWGLDIWWQIVVACLVIFAVAVGRHALIPDRPGDRNHSSSVGREEILLGITGIVGGGILLVKTVLFLATFVMDSGEDRPSWPTCPHEEACCRAVCQFDPACCDEWDAECNEARNSFTACRGRSAPVAGDEAQAEDDFQSIEEEVPDQGGTASQGGGAPLADARASARAAMASSNWRAAIDAWTSVLGLDPFDTEARAGLRQAQVMLDQTRSGGFVPDSELPRQRLIVQFHDDMARANAAYEALDFRGAREAAVTARLRVDRDRSLVSANRYEQMMKQIDDLLELISEAEQLVELAREPLVQPVDLSASAWAEGSPFQCQGAWLVPTGVVPRGVAANSRVERDPVVRVDFDSGQRARSVTLEVSSGDPGLDARFVEAVGSWLSDTPNAGPCLLRFRLPERGATAESSRDSTDSATAAGAWPPEGSERVAEDFVDVAIDAWAEGRAFDWGGYWIFPGNVVPREVVVDSEADRDLGVLVEFDSSHRARSVTVEVSSGDSRLDARFVEAVRSWQSEVPNAGPCLLRFRLSGRRGMGGAVGDSVDPAGDPGTWLPEDSKYVEEDFLAVAGSVWSGGRALEWQGAWIYPGDGVVSRDIVARAKVERDLGLRVDFNSDRRVRSVRVVVSSGDPRLDEWFRDAVAFWQSEAPNAGPCLLRFRLD